MGVSSTADVFSQESSSADIAREVLIFVPGFTVAPELNAMTTISQKIERGCRASGTLRARYLLEQRNTETYGENSKADVARITRTDVDGKPAIDVYDLQYQNEMLGDYAKMTPWVKAVSFSLALLNCIGPVLAIFRAALRGDAVRRQLSYGLMLYFAMWLYVVSLVLAALRTIVDQKSVQDAWGKLTWPLGKLRFEMHPPYFGHWFDPVWKWFAWLGTTGFVFFFHEVFRVAYDAIMHAANVIWTVSPRIALVITIVGIIVPGTLALVSTTATNLIAMLNYFNLGERRNRVTGQFGDLIRYVSQRQLLAHGSVSVRLAAHSFGCILLLDTLCFSDETTPSYLENIRGVCTIGNPFAIINTFWQWHFTNEHCRKFEAPLLNVWSKDDVLSSELKPIDVANNLNANIEDDDYSRSSHYARPTWWDLVTGFFFRAHTMYWDIADHPDASCFNCVVKFLYSTTTLLVDSPPVPDRPPAPATP